MVCHVWIFWRSYSYSSLKFTREIEEEEFKFKDVNYSCFETVLSLEPEIKIKFYKKNSVHTMFSDSWKIYFKMALEDPWYIIAKK